MSLKNKCYMVTGASADSDIGLAICRKLAKGGAKLILVGRRIDALKETQNSIFGSGHQVAAFDLSRLNEIKPWFSEVIKKNGSLDGVIHSASFQGYTPLRTLKPEQISQYFDINFSSALLLIAALSKSNHYKQDASVVLIGSAAGLRGLKARTLYAATKAALNSLTQSCALELADKGIRVNCVAPALVSGAKASKQFAMLGEFKTKQLLDAHPLGMSTPEDVANSVFFLLSDLSSNVTGSTLAVDGGYLAG